MCRPFLCACAFPVSLPDLGSINHFTLTSGGEVVLSLFKRPCYFHEATSKSHHVMFYGSLSYFVLFYF